MEVRLKIGRYAGEIKDVAPDIAKQMIEDGCATDPRFDGEFASGGIVSGGVAIVIGESVQGSFLPRATVEKFEALLGTPKARKAQKVRS